MSEGPGHPYHAIGEIDYPAADGKVDKGMILYIKPDYHGTETVAGVRSYAIANADFPHDSTANQWFGESQMESYRALGFEITDNLLREALKSLKDNAEPKLEDVLLGVSKLKPARSRRFQRLIPERCSLWRRRAPNRLGITADLTCTAPWMASDHATDLANPRNSSCTPPGAGAAQEQRSIRVCEGRAALLD
jgi:hypothetical protein